MEKSGFGIACDVRKKGHEVAEFPMLCETCLGDNPYVRMTRQHSGKECKICSRPYTVFRWKPGPLARFKQTIVCQTCAKLKNVCQTCLFDLEYGLPVQVRDKFLGEAAGSGAGDNCCGTQLASSRGVFGVDLHSLSNVNRDYFCANLDSNRNNIAPLDSHYYANLNHQGSLSQGYGTQNFCHIPRVQGHHLLPGQQGFVGLRRSSGVAPNAMLQRLARTSPYYRRNAPHVCTFWQRGECTRGSSCPYLHSEEKHDPNLAGQNIRDRYAGTDDPVAEKILRLNENSSMHSAQIQEDSSAATLLLRNVDPLRVTENDIRAELSAVAEIEAINFKKDFNIAFVTFASRAVAETVITALNSCIIINNCRIRLTWPSSTHNMYSLTNDLQQPEPIIMAPKSSNITPYYASMNPAEAELRK